MAIPQIQYVGFHTSDKTRDYDLVVRHPDGRRDAYTIAIPQEAFLSHRVRYQDAAEICFLKLSRALAAFDSAPGSEPPTAHQSVSEADLQVYREVHTPKPRRTFSSAPEARTAPAK